MSEAADNIAACAAELGVTMTAVFVPWSQSRNKDEKHRSLNWRVTLWRHGCNMLETDYSAGEAHCPSYKQRRVVADHYREIINAECETGYAHRWLEAGGRVMRRSDVQVMPALADVLASLALDSDVIDHATFESWASEIGYDTDSRKAEAIYRACLEIALRLRNGLGEDGLAKLRTACGGY